MPDAQARDIVTVLTVERLRELLDYDPEKGVFTWHAKRRGQKSNGIAGSLTRYGYRSIMIDGRMYRASRLAWLYVHGEWPEKIIDHINGVRDDDRIVNLRPANYAENAANRRQAKNCASGYRGVCWHKPRSKWQVRIKIDGKLKHLGTFDHIEEAVAVYDNAATAAFGEFYTPQLSARAALSKATGAQT